MNPAASAQRLMLGTGLGLLLATGFGYISGVTNLNSVGFDLLIPFLGLLLIFCSFLVKQENGVFSSLFPNQDNSQLSAEVENELTQSRKDDELGDAWAKLEHSMLSKELEEE
ncbi:MAG: hypothetical protein VW862_02230 [Euryarchaeota archaeon]|jgi:hypothetical protein